MKSLSLEVLIKSIFGFYLEKSSIKKEIDKLLDIAKQKGFDISDIVFDKY